MYLPSSLESSFTQAQYSTVFIQTEYADGRCGSGTGFFFSYPDRGNFIITIVTNKHVVQGAIRGRLRLHRGKKIENKLVPTGDWFDYEVHEMERYWYPHPDPSVDLCAMIAGDLMDECEKDENELYYVATSPSHVPTAETTMSFKAVEEVLMIGYPNGLWDSTHNLPLFRRGITASHPGVDFCGRCEGVVDIAAFPGSSGSPVMIIQEEHPYLRGDTVVFGGRVILLGVLYAGPIITVTGEIKQQAIPTTMRLFSETPLMLHLGYYIQSKEILKLCEALALHACKE